MDMIQKEQLHLVNQATQRMEFISRPEAGDGGRTSVQLVDGVTLDDFSWTLQNVVQSLEAPLNTKQYADVNKRAETQSIEDSWALCQPKKGSFQDLFSKIEGGREVLQSLGYDPLDQYSQLSDRDKYKLLTYLDVFTTALTGTEDGDAVLFMETKDGVDVSGEILNNVMSVNQRVSKLREAVGETLSANELDEVRTHFLSSVNSKKVAMGLTLVTLTAASCVPSNAAEVKNPTEVSMPPVVEVTQITPEAKVTPTLEQLAADQSALLISDAQLDELAAGGSGGAQDILAAYETAIRANSDWKDKELSEFEFSTFYIAADENHEVEVAYTLLVDGQSWMIGVTRGSESISIAKPLIIREVDEGFQLTYGNTVFMESTDDGLAIVRLDGSREFFSEGTLNDGDISFGKAGLAMVVPPALRSGELMIDNVDYVDGVLTAFDESGEAVLYLDSETGEWLRVFLEYPDWAKDEVKSASEVSGVLTAFDEAGEPVLVFDEESHEWIKAEDYMALWIEGEWTTEVPVRAVGGVSSFDYSEITKFDAFSIAEAASLPTTLTISDLRDPNLGVLLKEVVSNGEVAYWVVGEIVGFRAGQAVISQATGESVFTVQVLMDVPDLSRKSVVRVALEIDETRFNFGYANLEALQAGVEKMRGLGINPLVDEYKKEDYTVDGLPLYARDVSGRSNIEILENFTQKQELIGSQVGFLLPVGGATRTEGSPFSPPVTISENLTLKYLLEPSSQVNQGVLGLQLYDQWVVAFDVSMLD